MPAGAANCGRRTANLLDGKWLGVPLRAGKRGSVLLLALALLLNGCAGLDLSQVSRLFEPTAAPSAAPAAETPAATISAPDAQPSSTPEPTPPGDPSLLTVWLPPQFDPAEDTPAGKLLRQRLLAFTQANPRLRVETRIKALEGPGGLLESLAAASAAAPGAMPALVALPRNALEMAALKGLITPLDGWSNLLDGGDWYPYARQLGQIQGSAFGLPFGGDALLLVYRPSRMGTAPATWEALLGLGHPVAFAAADPQAMLTLNLYMQLGGAVDDDQRRPSLQEEVLARALKLYTDGTKAGVFPYALSQVQTDRQAWQAYEDQVGQWLVAWSSQYLSELPPESSAAPLPSLEGKSLALATGWAWALSDPNSERRANSARLAEFLCDPAFLAEWSSALGLLPVRPSSLQTWPNASLKPLAGDVARMAQVRPANDILSALSPALEAATLQVIRREGDATQAARAAAERLSFPVNK